jgi:uncharacterized repeat protein (TIGR01451 family)
MKQYYNIVRKMAGLFSFIMLTMLSNSSKAQNCAAGFAYSVGGGGQVTFFDSSWASGTITSYQWIFGDGTSGTGSQISHQYNGGGTYTVCLFITTSNGCSDSTCQVINLNGCNLSAFIMHDSLLQTLSVQASGGTPPYSYSWTNGANTATITATTSGTYCCVVTDANGCVFTTCYQLNGGTGCYASFITSVVGNLVYFGNNSQSFSSLLWDFGDGTTSTLSIPPPHTYAQPGYYYPCLTVFDGNGQVCSQYCDTIYIQASGGNAVICGNVFNDLNANGFNDNEPGYSNMPVYLWGNGLQLSAMPDSSGHYSISLAPGTYTVNYCVQQPFTLTLPPDSFNCGFYTVTIGAGDTICGFDFGVSLSSSSIEGYVFADVNNNGVMDALEAGIPYQPVQIGNQWAYTDINGRFERFVPIGNYTVSYTPSGNYASFALTTSSSYTVNVTSTGTTYQSGNFGLNIPAGSTNLAVSLLPHTTVTPGFPAWYDIQVCNIGINPTGATVSMTYDPGLTFTYANPTPASVNTTNHTITWNLSTIGIGSCRYINVDFTASTAYQIGDATFELCSAYPTIGTDIDLSNNVDTVHQIVTGSWDPNNKLSIQTNNNNPTQQIISAINSNQEIQYTINFQNLGTAPAVNVVVVDQLSANVNANSFQMMGASHNVQVMRNGNTVMYRFNNIMLPDAATNEPQSHGFVTYKVNANTGLAAGVQIADFADIYFDFNSPVTTNNAVVTMVNPTGINEQNNTTLMNAYPNPVNHQATVRYQLNESALVSLELLDASGRNMMLSSEVMKTAGMQETTIDAHKLANGIYLLKLSVNGHSSYTKISVQH